MSRALFETVRWDDRFRCHLQRRWAKGRGYRAGSLHNALGL